MDNPATMDKPAIIDNPATKTLKKNIALGGRLLSEHHHNDFNQGQISARLGSAEEFHIKQAIPGFSGLNPDDILKCSIDESITEKYAPPELPLHQAIYAARKDVKAIVHTHAVNCVLFGATDLELKPISHDATAFIDGVPRFTYTSNTILNRSVGDMVAEALGAHNAIFLRNHGVVVVGNSVRQAVILTIILEHACLMQLRAESLGLDFKYTSVSESHEKKDYIFSDVSIKYYWDYSIEQLAAQYPEIRAW